MPYIKREGRNKISVVLNELFKGKTQATDDLSTPGELNYAITYMIKKYLDKKGGYSYGNFNEIMGVLECAKLEFYRMDVIPYEDSKINENGPVIIHNELKE